MKMNSEYFYENVDVVVSVYPYNSDKISRVVICKYNKINNQTNDWERCDYDFSDTQTDEKIREYFDWVRQQCNPCNFKLFLISLLDI